MFNANLYQFHDFDSVIHTVLCSHITTVTVTVIYHTRALGRAVSPLVPRQTRTSTRFSAPTTIRMTTNSTYKCMSTRDEVFMTGQGWGEPLRLLRPWPEQYLDFMVIS